MSKATKRKHVTREVLEELVVPSAGQMIVRIVCGRGNNLHDVETATGGRFLASMPTKFRRNVWIKRGDYVIVDPIMEGNKVQAEIVHILFPMQVRHLKEEKLWPQAFEDQKTTASSGTRCHSAAALGGGRVDPSAAALGGGQESDDDSDLFVNTNRPPAPVDCESSSSATEESEQEEQS